LQNQEEIQIKPKLEKTVAMLSVDIITMQFLYASTSVFRC